MFRSILSACSIFVLLLPTLFFPTDAQACPVKFPETLLSLYRNSDAIYVARYDKADDSQVIEVTDERTVFSVRKHFDVSSALKGEPRKLFVLEERDYQYKSDEQEVRLDESPGDDEEVDALYRRPTLKSGDTVMLFLKEHRLPDGSKALALTDYRDAIKKMSAERLSAYEARIRELNSIFGDKKPSDAAILDWLVRAAQDPLTRWEGAFELKQSYDNLRWEEERKLEAKAEEAKAKANAEKAGSNEAGEETEQTSEEALIVESDDSRLSVYARLLTDAHKQTLLNVLLESVNEQPGTENVKKGIPPGDQVLVQLVSNWGDSRLARVLIERMQRQGDDAYGVYQLMVTTVRTPRRSRTREDRRQVFRGVLPGGGFLYRR